MNLVKAAAVLGALATAGLVVAAVRQRQTAPPAGARIATPGHRPSGATPDHEPTAAMPPAAPAGWAGWAGDWFEDVTARTGIAHTYATGAERGHLSILESLGGGVALFDADGDGDLDVFLCGGGGYVGPDGLTIRGRPSTLWRNDGGFTFTDVTAAAGIDTGDLYTHGVAVADVDRDGLDDLLVTGYGGLLLLRNEGGRFTDMTAAAGLDASTVADGLPAWNTSAAWADFDGDGDADLVVCRYVNWSFATHRRCWYHADTVVDVCPPRSFDPLPLALYRNDGDGTFREVAAAVGLLEPASLAVMKGLGVVAADLDGDHRPDIYVANDTTPNLLFLNRDGRFEEVAATAGVAHDDRGVANGSMGIAVGDPFAAGRPSLFVTNYQHELPALYRNDGGGFFTFASRSSGVAAVGLSHVGFGTAFADFDHDGWEDIVIVNGHVIRHPQGTTVAQRPALLRNVGRGRFAVATDTAGDYFRARHQGRGLAVGDLDDDGAVDIVVSHVDEPVAVLRNRAGSADDWLGIALVHPGRRDLVGTRVQLTCAGATHHRFVVGGGTYLSHSDRRLVFGLGRHPAGPVGVVVTWPDGSVDRWAGLPPGRYHRLDHGGSRNLTAADDGSP